MGKINIKCFLSAIYAADNPGPLPELECGIVEHEKTFHGSNDAGLHESLKYKKQLSWDLLDSKVQSALVRAQFQGCSHRNTPTQFFLSLQKKTCSADEWPFQNVVRPSVFRTLGTVLDDLLRSLPLLHIYDSILCGLGTLL